MKSDFLFLSYFLRRTNRNFYLFLIEIFFFFIKKICVFIADLTSLLESDVVVAFVQNFTSDRSGINLLPKLLCLVNPSSKSHK